MNPMMMAAMMILAVLASCTRSGSGGDGLPTTLTPGSAVGALHKVEGPPIDRLSMDQVNGIVQSCFAHHDLDGPQVPYTRAYCEKVFAERDLRSMKTPGKSTGNASVDPLH
jgi:hypothetical protein